MIYGTVRNKQNEQALSYQNIQLLGKADAQTRALGMEKHKTVNSAGSSEKAENDTQKNLLLGSNDKNKNSTDDRKELPAVVSEGEKLNGSENEAYEAHNQKSSSCQCEACLKRRYQDSSDDGGVSFQNPTNIVPSAVLTRVRAHESEHVRREQIKAKEDGRRIISQSVQIDTSVCPECGDIYVSGGKTRTVSRPDLTEFRKLFAVGSETENASKEVFNSIA